jgi:multiple sugar transport system permease protein
MSTVAATAPATAPRRRQRLTERARTERKLAYTLIAPAAIVMIAVTAYPVIDTIILSLQRADLRFPSANKFVGLSNYGHVLSASVWWQDVAHTAIITVVAVSIQFALGCCWRSRCTARPSCAACCARSGSSRTRSWRWWRRTPGSTPSR